MRIAIEIDGIVFKVWKQTTQPVLFFMGLDESPACFFTYPDTPFEGRACNKESARIWDTELEEPPTPPAGTKWIVNEIHNNKECHELWFETAD